MLPGSAQTYTDFAGDFAGLRALRLQARSASPGALKGAAEQFEALFAHALLKSMRSSLGDDPLLGPGGRMFTDMFDEQMSIEMSKSHALGIADLLVRQLEGTRPVASQPGSAARRAPPSPAETAVLVDPLPAAVHSPPGVAQVSPAASATDAFDSPRAFIDAVAPHARVAGRALGVDPGVLVAQAALETGWGRHVIRDAHGASTFNLFGIKADERWHGARVTAPTLEQVDGTLVRTDSAFRAYASIEESFRDYVRFINSQPRYRGAVEASDAAHYARALQAAGYATDPAYADKIIELARGEELAGTLSAPARTGGPVHVRS